MIETRLLSYFLAIAREQSITKAAQTLHITQPTLSKQLADLEDQLGRQLVIRGKKKLVLTEEGAFLRSRAQEILELMETTESTFRTQQELVGGDVVFGCGETPAMDLIAEVFRQVQQDNPRIHFHLFSGNADLVLERLDKGLLDIGLLLGPVPSEKYDYIDLHRTDRFGLILPAGCALAQKPAVELCDIIGVPLLVSSQSYGGYQLLHAFGVDWDALNVVATYNLITNAIYMVERGMGYAFCIDRLVNTNGRDLVFRPFTPAITTEIYLVTKRYQTPSPPLRVFLDTLAQYLPQS